MDKKIHTIQTGAGKVTIEETDGHVTILTEPLNVGNISVHLGTVWRDCDVAVCINGKWLEGAFAAGQWKHKT